MAKTFYTNGTGSQQTLTGSQNEKVAVYDTIADAEADLANLEAGQIVATPDTGDENAQPVDVIQVGNMHAVTSNAVATSNAMPVDVVALNNLHSVTSNAVARALQGYATKTDALSFLSVTPQILNTPASLTAEVKSLYDQGYRLIILSVGWQDHESYPHAGAMGIFILTETSAIGTGFLREYSSYKFNYACHWTDYIRTDRFTGWVQIS